MSVESAESVVVSHKNIKRKRNFSERVTRGELKLENRPYIGDMDIC